MSHRSRQLQVSALARIEGEGALNVVVADGQVLDAELRIYEPPRFFEAFLRGRQYTEATDITSRICGICPVAWPRARGTNDRGRVRGHRSLRQSRDLRRLLYCGEWISSHALHMFLLQHADLPFFPAWSRWPPTTGTWSNAELRLKKAWSAVLEDVRARAIPAVNARVGSICRGPDLGELAWLGGELRHVVDDALTHVAVGRWLGVSLRSRWTATC